ncbi:hypothetical protein P5705_02095 [Pseudomonas entomophila]|uniref:hypothetical protein n=1 Tax=Pseudomonas entomophila TaxID=312306 RepID=UPI002405FED5|nr:hypothetical protein [Pseudomonas entomophila]MDF9616424.1 hypothetical protein [Pseudomonas entomophila]
MIYNAEFVNELLGNFHASFLKNKDKWCTISQVGPEGNAYKKKMYQKLYTLRFFPAYYLEYCLLASELKQRLPTDCKSIQVASFGCGICPDYYALRDNLGDVEFDYYGFDNCQWSTQRLIPENEDDNLIFHHLNTKALKRVDLEEIDVFVFPKSISDIAASGGLERLAKSISATENDRIFFLNSYVSNGSESKKSSGNLRHFDVVHEALSKVGFSTQDDRYKTRFKGTFGEGLRKVSWDFCYPDELKLKCADQGKFPSCEGCNVVKLPVMTNRFMDYQLLEYTRT